MPTAITAAMCAAGRSIAEPRLSPDGRFVVFLERDGDRTALVRMATEGGPELVLTSDPQPARCHPDGGGVLSWGPANDEVSYLSRDGALWSVSMHGGPARCLLEPVAGRGAPVFSPDRAHVAYHVDMAQIWVASLDGSAPQPLGTTASFVLDPVWLDAERLAWMAWDVPDMPWDRSRIEGSLVGSGVVEVLVDRSDAQCQQPIVSVGGDLFCLTDAAGWLNLHQVIDDELRPVVRELFEHGGPTWGDRQRTVAISPDGRRIALCRNEGGFGRLLVVDRRDGSVREVAKAVHRSLDWRGSCVVAIRSGGTTPTQLVAYDSETWERTVLARGPVGGVEAAMVEPELVTCPTADGASIPARLYVPAAGATGRLICWIHGGPTDQWVVDCNLRIAFAVDRGWSVLVPDFRGSTGHGRAFTQALRGRWGELDTADVVAAIDTAIERGWGATVVLMGGSAGGFTSLGVASLLPGLVSSVAVAFPVTDLIALTAATHRFEAHYCEHLVGPFDTDLYRARSVDADGIFDPLLLLHGSADLVVDVGASRALVARLQALGRPAELVEYDGEGHGWRQSATMIDELNRLEAFLEARTVGGAP